MADEVPPRLFVLLAREAPVGVIFRRGPTKWCELVKWQTGTDAMHRGQWLHARIYERRSDLSPDGTKLVYFALDGRYRSETRGSYTAISKPPYWAPLAVWPNGNAANGGGLFIDNRKLFLNQTTETLKGKEPRNLAVVTAHPYGEPVESEWLSVYYPKLRRDGWEQTVAAPAGAEPRVDVWRKVHPKEPYRLIKEVTTLKGSQDPPVHGGTHDRYRIELADGSVLELTDAEWADFDHRDRLIFTRKGILSAAAVNDGQLIEKQIADFNPDKPRPVEPPFSARNW